MSVWALGLNHTTAPLDLRGRFAFAIDQIAPTLHSLRHSFGSRATRASRPRSSRPATAPRSTAPPTTGARPHGRLAGPERRGRPPLLRSHAYTLHDDQAARHAFRVASGLDSMVLGEPQILGQMKDAVRAAEPPAPSAAR